jgi:hypothetical protein
MHYLLLVVPLRVNYHHLTSTYNEVVLLASLKLRNLTTTSPSLTTILITTESKRVGSVDCNKPKLLRDRNSSALGYKPRKPVSRSNYWGPKNTKKLYENSTGGGRSSSAGRL